MIAELRRVARSCLDAGIGEKPNNDNTANPVLLELEIEIGICEAARPPMLLDDGIARLRYEIRMPFAMAKLWRRIMRFWAGVGWDQSS